MNEVARITAQSTSIAKSTDPGNAHRWQLAMEGQVEGVFEGVFLCTLTVITHDLRNGMVSVDGALFATDGNVIGWRATGVSVALGGHRWRVSLHEMIEDGRTVRVESELDLATRKWTGKVYD